MSCKHKRGCAIFQTNKSDECLFKKIEKIQLKKIEKIMCHSSIPKGM